MKVILLAIFLLSTVLGETKILIGEKRNTIFVKTSRIPTSNFKNQTYYMYGTKKVLSNGTLIIKFKELPSIETFSNDNSLQLIRKNSTGTFIFKNLSEDDIIDKANELSKKEFILLARPSWKGLRVVK
jgi:hypothetical protein